MAGSVAAARAGATILVPAGNGVLLCEGRTGRDRSSANAPIFYLKARSWLHLDQLHSDQELAILPPAAPGEEAFGDGVLLPAPLRAIDLTRHSVIGPTPLVFKPLLPLPRRAA